MKDTIRRLLEQAEAIDKELHLIRGKLGSYEGEQLNEARTEQQLDRWTRERGMDEAVDSAVAHMKKVLSELQWILEELGE